MYLKQIINNWNNPELFEKKVSIDKNNILKLIAAAHWAPSAENQQVWKFLVVDKKKIKEIVKESVNKQDPRLSATKHKIEKPILNAKFVFSTENFDALKDKYKDFIEDSHKNDIRCSETASLFIIYIHSKKFLGNTFGASEIGAAVINTIIESYDLGYNCRWIRNFDRKYLIENLNIPDNYIIDSILAVGKEKESENILEIDKKDLNDFIYINAWENIYDFSNYQNQQDFNDYDVEAVDAILDRRSIRDFNEEKNIPPNIKYELMKAAMMVPLTISKQYIKIVMIDDSDKIQQIANNSKIVIRRQKHVQQVPLIFVLAYDCSNNSPAFYAEGDTGAIIQNILLRAHSLGIGSCWIGAFNREKTKNILNIPEHWHIPTLAILGYPNDYPPPTPRKDLGKICYYNKWKNQIKNRKRSLMPSSHFLSILFRRMRNGEQKSILRERKVGEVEEIPEFKKLKESE